MATLIINDLVESKELDREAMAAVAGGMGSMDELAARFPFILDLNVVSTALPVTNVTQQWAAASNEVGAFNFGNVAQTNNQVQVAGQLGNFLGG
jgi:hypothetical protein